MRGSPFKQISECFWATLLCCHFIPWYLSPLEIPTVVTISLSAGLTFTTTASLLHFLLFFSAMPLTSPGTFLWEGPTEIPLCGALLASSSVLFKYGAL